MGPAPQTRHPKAMNILSRWGKEEETITSTNMLPRRGTG
jgi:hypothetical protein